MVLAHGYVYTADGKLQSETLPSGVVVSYVYTQDKLSGISLDGQAYMSNIRYNAASNVTSWQWADGTTYSKTYDANGKLQTFPLGNVTRTLSYDSVGNITGWDDNGDAAKAKHFSYDLLDRLEGYTAANETQAFQYDSNGNRTTKTDNGNTTVYGLQPNSNRLTQIGNVYQTLDANGNLLNDGAHSYTYNAQNRLVSVDGATTYGYNADDQRVKKTTQTGTTLYAWDNDHIIGEYTQGNQNSTAQATETIYFGNTPVAAVQNGNIYRIYADQIDTPRVITDATGKTVWSWESKPFGETAPNEDPDQDGLSLHYSQRFPGQTYDAETGLHYNFHRDYNPQTGRYVQSDPIGLGGGMNSFAYVKASPILLIDSQGTHVKVQQSKDNKTVNLTIGVTYSYDAGLTNRTTAMNNAIKSAWTKTVGIYTVKMTVNTTTVNSIKMFYKEYNTTNASEREKYASRVYIAQNSGKWNTYDLNYDDYKGYPNYTAAHEAGHLMGLPDYYSLGTSYLMGTPWGYKITLSQIEAIIAYSKNIGTWSN